MKKTVGIKNLDCANCANKLENKLSKVEGVNSVNINFMSLKMNIEIEDNLYQTVVSNILKITKKIEPDIEYCGL